MRVCYYDSKRNTLYINSDILFYCDRYLSIKERRLFLKERRKLSYMELINDIKNIEYKNKILCELLEHKGCDISEFLEM